MSVKILLWLATGVLHSPRRRTAICTEWQQFRAPDFAEMAERLNSQLIFDGRNVYAPDRLRAIGWTYVSIERIG